MSPNINVKTQEEIKARRVAIDAEIQYLNKEGFAEKDVDTFDRNLYRFAEAQVLRALTEAKMWYGKMLEGLGTPFPAELADRAKIE